MRIAAGSYSNSEFKISNPKRETRAAGQAKPVSLKK
jgi:hypothetical protein